MSFENTISIIKLIQKVFPDHKIRIDCGTSIIKDGDIQTLKSEIKESGIKNGRILRVDDIRLQEEQEKYDQYIKNWLKVH